MILCLVLRSPNSLVPSIWPKPLVILVRWSIRTTSLFKNGLKSCTTLSMRRNQTPIENQRNSRLSMPFMAAPWALYQDTMYSKDLSSMKSSQNTYRLLLSGIKMQSWTKKLEQIQILLANIMLLKILLMLWHQWSNQHLKSKNSRSDNRHPLIALDSNSLNFKKLRTNMNSSKRTSTSFMTYLNYKNFWLREDTSTPMSKFSEMNHTNREWIELLKYSTTRL